MVIGCFFVLVLFGCRGQQVNAPTQEPADRAFVRGAVLTLSAVSKAGDKACAAVVRSTGNASLGDNCGLAVRQTERALLATEAVLDSWKAGMENKLGCAFREAVTALERLKELLASTGAVTPTLEDALSQAHSLTRFALTCEEKP